MKKRGHQQPPLQPTPSNDNSKQIRRSSSLASSSNPGRPSSIASYAKQTPTRQDPRPINDRSYQMSCIRALNQYLESHRFPGTLLSQKGLPSGKDVKDIISFLVHQLDPTWGELGKLEDEVPFIFRVYGYPFQINKSALYAAGSPHSWPALLAALAWLVQLLNYKERVHQGAQWFDRDAGFEFVEQSYQCFLRGDDAAVESLNNEFIMLMEEERAATAQRTAAVEALINELEAKLEDLKTGPSAIETLERNKAELANDVSKFHSIVNNFSSKKDDLERCLGERKQELEAKNSEVKRLAKENEALKQQVESQHVNIRDYEKMNRECNAIELDIQAAQASRNEWEEKAWDVEVSASKKLKELEAAIDRYNQEIMRLKLGSSFEYKLNTRGLTPTEILGVDFKDTIKPGLVSATEDYLRIYREKWEETIALQQQLNEKISEQERKKKTNTDLVTKIKKLEARYSAIRKGMEDYVSSKAAECERLSAEVENNECEMKKKETKTDDSLQKARLELEEITKRYDEEIQVYSNELLQFVDRIAKHKEHVETTISTVKTAVHETTQKVNSMYSRRHKS